MSDVIAVARAPSNIALVKYMGKLDCPGNLPENPSISMTLDGLFTRAEIRRKPSPRFDVKWVPELPESKGAASLRIPKLSETGFAKVVNHIQRAADATPALLRHYGISVTLDSDYCFELRSANTFPAASGIASSASSFAAITTAAALSFSDDFDAFNRAWAKEPSLRRALAKISREGSGSSCRSFEGPFVHWEHEEARVVPSNCPELAHFVLLISSNEKKVSSSQAHARVKSSPLWNGRVARATQRTKDLIHALSAGDLKAIAQVTWSEAWEMHSLFHTAEEPFSYWEPGTVKALQVLSEFVQAENLIVTLDAGPNVHVIVEKSQAQRWLAKLNELFPGIPLLRDQQGTGAQPESLRR